MLVSLPQFLATVGICTGYFTCYGSIQIESSLAWRLPFIIMGVMGTLLTVSCFYLPTSPRWLQVHGRRQEALREVGRLGISSAEAEKDIFAPSNENAPPRAATTLSEFLLLFNKQYRMRTSLGVFILGMVQLCGIDGVLYVSCISHGFLIFQTSNITLIVRSNPIHSSWPAVWHRLFPCIRAFSNPHASDLCSRIPLCRQLGSKDLRYHWWYRTVSLYVCDRKPLCRR